MTPPRGLRPVHRVVLAGAMAAFVLPVASAFAHSGIDRARAASHPVASAECTQRVSAPDRSTVWAAPLDRIISLQLPDTALREAIDRVGRTAQLELSYSSDFLPRGKRVCLSLDRVSVGAVLETLLEGTTLRAVVIGTSQVVLAPTRGASIVSSTPVVTRRASVLDRVVVTGTPDGASQRGSPFALDVVDGVALSRTNSTTLGEALELAVPGVWTWSGTAGTLTARFGSIRGASSFGVTTPKVYLDGVEVANPLLVTQIDPARIERVEIIRGPQGAALYGAEAISGVVNILTRHDGTPTGAFAMQLSTSAGVASTAYAARNPLVQDHAVSLRGGSGRQTFGLGLSLSSVGAYVPGASERRILTDADVRFARSRSVITGTARFSFQKANASSGLLFGGAAPVVANSLVTRAPGSGSATGILAGGGAGPGPDNGPPPALDTVRFAGDSAIGQDMSQYTVGATVTTMPSLRWTNTLIAGVDGYRLRGLSSVGLPLPASYGSDPSTAEGAADRGTLRLRSVGRFDIAERMTLALTIGAEQALTRDVAEPLAMVIGSRQYENEGQAAGGLRPPRVTDPTLVTTWTSTTGLLAQGNYAWRDALFVVAGARAERTTGATPNAQLAYLPMLGATYVHDVRGMVLKVRGAFGTGIRPAHSLARAATWMGRTPYVRNAALEPESQSGTEAGVDLLVGRALQLHVTRFDQRASGLIQPVATSTETRTNGRTIRLVDYTLQNVGAIDNHGWELQGSTTIDRLRLGAAYTIVESRVARVAAGYNGDLRVGDRMLDVPARTGSVSATWFTPRWTLSSTLARADDWISYDRIAIGKALASTGEPRDLSGARLREFWARYDDVTRLRANIAFRFTRQLSAEIGGDNLLGIQRGAPDNATVTAGRTLTFGLRTQF